MTERAPIDWECVEREYRAGQLSVSEIGRQYGVSHTAINKRAKRDGWTRNLAERVKQEVSARLVSDGVSAKTARETVDQVAARVVQVVREHREDIATGRRLVRVMFGELEIASADQAAIEEAIFTETKDDQDSGRRRASMLRSVSLASRVSIVKDLSMALKNLIPLEREAFGLATAQDGAAVTVEITGAAIAAIPDEQAAAAYRRMVDAV